MASTGPGATGTRLANILARGITATRTLRACLKAERDALERQDCDALLQAAASKQETLASLEAIESERRALLATAGLPAGADGMQMLASAHPDVSDSWRHYSNLARDCRDENLTNGAILRLRQQQFAGALAALSGCRPPTYGPAGGSDGTMTRALAEA